MYNNLGGQGSNYRNSNKKSSLINYQFFINRKEGLNNEYLYSHKPLINIGITAIITDAAFVLNAVLSSIDGCCGFIDFLMAFDNGK